MENYHTVIKGTFKNLNTQISKGLKNTISLRGSNKPSIHFGTNVLSGKNLYLSIPDDKKGLASTHTYLPGRSGVGKSKFLERIARDIIKNGYGLIFLDGKGDLYDDLLDFCALMRLEDKTILIDPNDTEHSVGINYLELLGNTRRDALADLVLEALKKFFGEQDEYKPWLEEWAPAALKPLIESNLTLAELFDFMSISDPSFRDAVLEATKDEYLRRKWKELDVFKPYEQSTILNVVRTRANEFQNPTLKAIFGQQKTTIDWLKVMNEGGIVLAKLGRTEKVSQKTDRLIGAAILHQITTIAPSRPQGQRRPCFFMIDEFQKFVTSDFADAFDLMRGLGIHFILSHQHRAQLEKETPEIMSSIDANCRNKIVFSLTREDSEKMALELFSGWIHKGAEEIKDEIWQTKFRPVKTYEEIVAQTTTQNFGKSRDSQSSTTTGSSMNFSPEGDVIITVNSSASAGGSAGESENWGDSISVQKAPWYDYEEFQELSSQTKFTIEEVKEKFIAWVQRQDDRHAQWQFKSAKPIPLVTPTIEKAIVLNSIKERFEKEVCSKYARPTAEVLKEIDERAKKFIEERRTAQKMSINTPKEPTTYRRKKTTKKP